MVQAARHPLQNARIARSNPILREFGVARIDARGIAGGAMDAIEAAYALVGPRDAPVIAVLGGISADRGVAVREDGSPGWWSALFAPSGAVDTARFRVLSLDFLGGNGQTTGPRVAGAPRPFPEVSTHDQARVLERLLDHLGIDALHAFIGASYGGMVALAFAELFPGRLERAFVISAAHKSAALATAWRTIQRQIVALAEASGRGDEGLALARALAMTTYRTGEELDVRFDGPRLPAGGADDFPVWKYLEARGADYVARMHPEAFVTLSRSIDLHAVSPERIHTPLTLVSVRQDQCVPAGLSAALAERAAGPTELVSIDSLYGHDAFLKETSFFSDFFRRI